MSRHLPALTSVILLLQTASGGVPAEPPAPAPEAVQGKITDARDALRKGRIEEAIELLGDLCRQDPDDEQAWLLLGQAHGKRGDWPAAVTAYRMAIQLEPSSARSWHNLGNAEYRVGHYEAAAESYAEALERDPEYLLATFHYGWTLRQLNRTDDAEKMFRQCLEIVPGSDRDRGTQTDCRFGLGSVLHRRGDYESSAAIMEQVIRVHPSHPEARYYLAMAYRQLGRLEPARQQMEIHRRLLESRRKQAPIEAPDSE